MLIPAVTVEHNWTTVAIHEGSSDKDSHSFSRAGGRAVIATLAVNICRGGYGCEVVSGQNNSHVARGASMSALSWTMSGIVPPRPQSALSHQAEDVCSVSVPGLPRVFLASIHENYRALDLLTGII